ncbi:hypothetical protein Taro_039955 [Colocasia esculenta]|uniref:Pectinesterase catalytic domain-containing protein n=1 Tax=Colocasia esculenta TaxID=4460 RepID=A0A843WNS8_COLES|nr:hypothetical protein [Colocasia esculenta]
MGGRFGWSGSGYFGLVIVGRPIARSPGLAVTGTSHYGRARQSASVYGKGFIARDMGFRNTAGPAKHQAVALMSNSDLSVFYRCRFDAYQDTLYANSLRQFYRECDIYGTVDSYLWQRRHRLPVLHPAAAVRPWGDLSSVKVYQGRPWKAYFTTVFMRSVLSGVINPAGWLAWRGNSAPSTIFYAKYQNTGPGASTRNRVKWKGVRTQKQASRFTVG